MNDNHEHHEPMSYGLLILVWLSLLVLTALTVTATGMNFGALSVTVAVVIAAIKSSVVLFFFMHLKYEKSDDYQKAAPGIRRGSSGGGQAKAGN